MLAFAIFWNFRRFSFFQFLEFFSNGYFAHVRGKNSPAEKLFRYLLNSFCCLPCRVGSLEMCSNFSFSKFFIFFIFFKAFRHSQPHLVCCATSLQVTAGFFSPWPNMTSSSVNSNLLNTVDDNNYAVFIGSIQDGAVRRFLCSPAEVR